MEKFELISTNDTMPMKIFIHSINNSSMHWHKEMEILLVLDGSIRLRLGTDEYEMHEGDLILLNPNEVHSVIKTEEDNILLALQIQGEFYNKYFLGFTDRVFECKSFLDGSQEKFDKIRSILAKLVVEINKKRPGYEFLAISHLAELGSHLINNFPQEQLEHGTSQAISRDMFRLNRIIEYIDQNIREKITLNDLAENEGLSIYYLSHYIKRVMGITFQEYINFERLNIATDLLLSTDKTIAEIARESGFPSTKALNTVMQRSHESSPTDYRKKHIGDTINLQNSVEKSNKNKIKSKTYLDVDRETALSKLFKYLNYEEDDKNIDKILSSKEVLIDISEHGEHNDFYWQRLTTFGRAAEGLRSSVQNQLRDLQDQIGFEHIRFHGIFSDEMMISNIGKDGKIVYNWTYVDELFDFFGEVGIKPFIELGFMPSEIKKSDESMFWWKANISGPREMELWTDLVENFLRHCINRYGLNEVKTWHLEVWNEPSFENVFWAGSKEDYFEFYRETALAVKSISEELQVGGPAIAFEKSSDKNWLDDFLNYCRENGAPLDFISAHIYPETFDVGMARAKDPKASNILDTRIEAVGMIAYQYIIYHGRDHTHKTIDLIKEKIDNAHYGDKKIHITEWNASSYGRNLINDTCFIATFIIRNILKSRGRVDSMGYWTFTDFIEEHKLGISSFHGGYGLISKDGLKKPSYYAYYLLSKLGREIIAQDEEYIVTKEGEDIQVLAFNFAYFDELFMRGDISRLNLKERYEIYEHKAETNIKISLSGLNGGYKVICYSLNREQGSAFDEWIKLGAPENMTKEEVDYLKGKSQPHIKIDYIDILNGSYSKELSIPVHGVEMIILEKQI